MDTDSNNKSSSVEDNEIDKTFKRTNQELKDLLKLMLKYDPKERMSAA